MSDQTLHTIGAVKGPGEHPHEYLMVTADPDHRAKYGEYVYYRVSVDGNLQLVYGRITARRLLRSLPDAFMADASVSPYEITRLLGIGGGDGRALYELTVSILGYYDGVMGFVNPRVPPAPGEPIYIAEDETLRNILCKATVGEPGGVHVGSLLSRKKDSVPIAMDARGFTSTHLAIIASTGSGKSYLAGVMIEELLKPHNRAAVLILDPHGEYDTLLDMHDLGEFQTANYRAKVSVRKPDSITVRISSLRVGDLVHLMPDVSDRMRYTLQQSHSRVWQAAHNHQWSRDQLMMDLGANGGNLEAEQAGDGQEDPSARALLWRLDSIFKSRIFDDFQNMPLDELLRPGQCTILQLNDIPEREQQIIVATLLRRLYRARMDSARGEADANSEDYLPYPGFVLIEEAHNFAPAGAEIVTTQILKQILSEGRKFGLAMGLISQRPGKLDSDVLSQCMTQCIMRIVNPVDQARISESVESVGRDLLTELPALSRGQVIVAGASVNTPVLVQVRERLTRHGGEDPDAIEAWANYFSRENAAQRQRDNAPPSDAAYIAAQDQMGAASGPPPDPNEELPF